MEQILIAVSMITGTGDFTQMAKVGLLIGVLIIFFQSIMNGAKEIQIGTILVAWIFYAMAFLPSTTVLIEDAYSGEVRVVDNVPVGPAAVGSVLSNLGYSATSLFEQGYSFISPGSTQNRFADSLQLINQLQDAAVNPVVFKAMDNAIGGEGVNVELSIHNYIRECTLTKVDLHQASIQDLYTDPAMQALRFESDLYGTRLYLGGSPQDYTCSDGFVALTNALNEVKGNYLVHEAIERGMREANGGVAGISMTNRLYDALASLGMTGSNAQDYVITTLLKPIYEDAAQGKYQDMQDFSSAIMLNQAIQQRNTQWAAEQSMFMTIVRPMMTFFEGFVYAITPLAAIFMLMGRFGIGLVGKYLVTIAWIQLWMPVLSIINLYIHMSATGALSTLENDPFSTFHGISEAYQITSSWLGTGGMLAAATPVITLFVVTGSTYAMTSLAGKLGGGDHVNEKITSPDVVKPSPVLDMMPKSQFDDVRGLQVTGSESMVDKVNVGNMLSSAVSSSQASSSQATQSFASQLSNSVFSGASAEQSYARLQGLGQTLRASDSSQAQAIYGQAQDYARQYGLNESHTDAIAGAVAMRASGSVDAAQVAKALPIGRFAAVLGGASGATGSDNDKDDKKGGRNSGKSPISLEAGVSGTATSTSTDQRQQFTNDIDRLAKNVGFTESDSAALTRDIASQMNTESGQRFANSLGEEQREQLSESATQAITAQNAYQRLASAQSSIGTTSAMDMRALAQKVIGSPEAHSQLRDGMRMASPETRQLAVEKAQFYEALGTDSARATVAGQLYSLINSGTESEQVIAADSIVSATGSAISVGDFNAQQNLVQSSPEITGGSDAPKLQEPRLMSNEQRDQARADIPDEGAVFQRHDQNLNRVEAANSANREDYQGERLGDLRSQIMASEVEPSFSAGIFSVAESGGRIFDRVVGGVSEGADGFSDDFAGSMRHLATMTPEERDQFIADSNRGDQYIQDEYGVAGHIAVGAADLGRSIIGAGVSGYTAAKEWITGESDLSEAAKDMSLREKGMFFAAALASASEEGAEHAQRFVEQYGDEFRELAVQTAIHEHGLQSQAGAQLFASSLLGESDGREAEYRQQLQSEFGGDAELANKAADIIEASAGAGREQAGGYLMPVTRYMAVQNGE
tara:strand:- start:12897 stop:16337 length:3441 start_codon:yes stop_codon:yes gene_type:complete